MATSGLLSQHFTKVKTFAPDTTKLMVQVFREEESEHPFDWDCACEECMRKQEDFA